MTVDPRFPDEVPLFAEGERVAVLLPLPLAGAYDYRVGPGQRLASGDFVRVPLGRRDVVGVVWGAGSEQAAEEKLRPVAARLDAPPLRAPLRRLIDWTAAYTVTPPGAVLRMALSVPSAIEPPAAPVAYVAVTQLPPDFRPTPARRRVLEAAWAPMPAAELARAAGVGIGTVRALAAAGALEPVRVAPRHPAPDPERPGPVLSEAQAFAAAEMTGRVGQGFSTTMLEGVTGSGKTEIYLDAAAEALRQGRQVLVMLPEIALTGQGLARFAARFGAEPAPWHSDLTEARRRAIWRGVAEGDVRIVVGARSALFLPFAELGLIVVDEEHDGSFKQDEGVTYQARDMAVVRAREEAIPIVLASATPSLETRINAATGRYRRLHLPDRHAGALMPDIALVDLRRNAPPRGSWLSPPLVEALNRNLETGEQSLLFLNRRGYAPLTLCRACGFRFQCPDCSAWLVEHRQIGRLVCHHCGHAQLLPPACPQCGEEGRLAPVGPGIERLAEEVARQFPAARAEIMASDTLFGPRAVEGLVGRMERREIDILIGTQVVAKGYHFPLLTLVGVIDADLGLAGGDLRAGERTFQLLSQVAGRAGREERPGRVLLQTLEPGHPVMAALASGDAERFYQEETAARRAAHMPPFGRLAALILSGPDEAAVAELGRRLARIAPHGEGIETLGPAPAPLSRLRGRHRLRFLVKTARAVDLQKLLHGWLGGIKLGGGLRIQVDVDPYSFL